MACCCPSCASASALASSLNAARPQVPEIAFTGDTTAAFLEALSHSQPTAGDPAAHAPGPQHEEAADALPVSVPSISDLESSREASAAATQPPPTPAAALTPAPAAAPAQQQPEAGVAATASSSLLAGERFASCLLAWYIMWSCDGC